MKANFFITLLMVVAATLKVAATDRFFIEDFYIQPNQTVPVEILLDNESQYTAFQADLHLPDGLTVVEGSFSLTSRKGSDHTLSTSILPNGGIRLMSYSMRVNAYKGNDGALVGFLVTASEDLNLPATVTLKNILFTTTAGTEVALCDTQCFVFGFLRGDVNLDGEVNIADVTALIDLLFSSEEAPDSADVNNDGDVNIKDTTDLIDILLTGN